MSTREPLPLPPSPLNARQCSRARERQFLSMISRAAFAYEHGQHASWQNAFRDLRVLWLVEPCARTLVLPTYAF